jgi:hypothetical protein
MKPLFTFSRALARVCWALVTFQPVFVSPKVATERLATCIECEHFDAVDRKCSVCKCYVDAKTLLATESCPEKRWRRDFGLIQT